MISYSLKRNARFGLVFLLLGTSCAAPSSECESSQSQNATTVCGLNNEGVLIQTCANGVWASTGECTGKDLCHNGDAESQECGFNNSGIQTRRCSEGAWEEWAECDDLDVCTNDTRESQPCGNNENGTQNRGCNQGQWGSWGECNDPDECASAQVQNGTTPCGFNNAGSLLQTCVDGQWADDSAQCEDPDYCANGTEESESCGINNNGTHSRSCYEGNWTHFNDCVDSDVCINESTGTSPCGINSAGTSTRTCADGQWGPFECVDPDICLNGLSQNGTTSCGEGFIGVYRQDCENGQWIDDTEDCSGVCVDLDNHEDTDLQFYPWEDSDTTILFRECPENMVVVGVRGYAGSWIDQITLLCQTLHPTGYVTGEVQALSPVGTSTGGSESDDYRCPQSRIMVGALAGDKLNYVSCVRPHCADVDYIASFNPSSEYTSADIFGQESDCSDATVGNALCPDGHVVTGVVGRQHYTYAGSLQWQCRPLKNCGP